MLLLTVCAIATEAVSASPRDDFESGIQSFRQGDHAAALEYFERAETGGFESPRLFYNLAVVYYRLNRFDDSKRYFEILQFNDEFRALALYNLGLVEFKLGRNREAIAYFEQSLVAADDERLRALARKQIDTLRKREAGTRFGYVSVDYGYDSNVALQPSDGASGESSSFGEVLGLLGGRLHGDDSGEIHATIAFLSRDYSGGSSFDNDVLRLVGEFRHRIGAWKYSYGLGLVESTYSSRDFLRQGGLVFKADKRLSERGSAGLELVHEDISGLSDEFAFLDGDRTRFKVEYRHASGADEYRYRYRIEVNDRADTASASFSPTRHEIGVRYRREISPKTRLGVTLDYRYSDYEKIAAQDRNDTRYRLRLEARYQMNKTWRVGTELLFADNESSEDPFDYHKYQYTLGLSAIFQ